MGRIDVSESSFQLAFLHAWLGEYRNFISEAPFIPSTRAENYVGGYDAKVNTHGIEYYFQFKMSYFLSRSLAKEWSLYNSSYFRFNLHKPGDYKQHNDLCHLSEGNDHVYYVAPLFTNEKDFNNAFNNGTIIDKSFFFLISRCRAYQLDEYSSKHSITYSINGSNGYQHSEHVKLLCIDGEQFKNKTTHIVHDSNHLTSMNEQHFIDQIYMVHSIAKELEIVHDDSLLNSMRKHDQDIHSLKHIYARMLFSWFKILLFLVYPPNSIPR